MLGSSCCPQMPLTDTEILRGLLKKRVGGLLGGGLLAEGSSGGLLSSGLLGRLFTPNVQGRGVMEQIAGGRIDR